MSDIKITVTTLSNGGSSTVSAIIEKALREHGFTNINVNDRDGKETYEKVRDNPHFDEMVEGVALKTDLVDITQTPNIKRFSN